MADTTSLGTVGAGWLAEGLNKGLMEREGSGIPPKFRA